MKLRQLDMELFGGCNYSCSMCPQGSDRGREPENGREPTKPNKSVNEDTTSQALVVSLLGGLVGLCWCFRWSLLGGLLRLRATSNTTFLVQPKRWCTLEAASGGSATARNNETENVRLVSARQRATGHDQNRST